MGTLKPQSNHIALFRGKTIRKTIYQKEWWFSIIDVVEVLTDSVNPRDYWYKMKIRVKDEEGFEPSTICRQLKLKAPDGKMRETDCAKLRTGRSAFSRGVDKKSSFAKIKSTSFGKFNRTA